MLNLYCLFVRTNLTYSFTLFKYRAIYYSCFCAKLACT